MAGAAALTARRGKDVWGICIEVWEGVREGNKRKRHGDTA
jgi:hypothetical protein